jgi:hypothetical protein
MLWLNCLTEALSSWAEYNNNWIFLMKFTKPRHQIWPIGHSRNLSGTLDVRLDRVFTSLGTPLNWARLLEGLRPKQSRAPLESNRFPASYSTQVNIWKFIMLFSWIGFPWVPQINVFSTDWLNFFDARMKIGRSWKFLYFILKKNSRVLQYGIKYLIS